MVDTTLVALTFGSLVALLYYQKSKAPKYNLPPGPKPAPIIANTLQMPKHKPWLTYAKWAKEYGDIMYIKAAGRNIVILNTAQAVHDLLDRRSAIYSDRPRLIFAGELLGFSRATSIMPHNDGHKLARRLINQTIGPGPVKEYVGLQEYETTKFLGRLAQTPDSFMEHVRLTAGAIILKISHGYDVQEKDDYFVKLAEDGLDAFSAAIQPGRFLVDFFPFLLHVPEWMPGTQWKQIAKQWSNLRERMYNLPFAWTKDQMSKGTAIPSFVSTRLSELEQNDKDGEEVIKFAAVSLFGGGADTSVSAISSFFLLMALYPEVQRKAQEEIDNLVKDRLPKLSDRASLKYVEAVMLEVNRLNPVAPLAIPHRLIQDDHYAGFDFPKDTLFYPNSWKILHDEELYAPDPFTFRPDRFLEQAPTPEIEKARNPMNYVFGYGRRICPGLHLAEGNMFLSIAMTLAAFNITPKKDEKGNPILPPLEYTSGSISHPEPFKVEITPRSKEVVNLVRGIIEAGKAN